MPWELDMLKLFLIQLRKSKYSKELPNAQPDGRAHFNTGKALHDYYKDKGIGENFIYKKNIPNAWLIGTEPSKEKHFAQYPKRLCSSTSKSG